MNSWKDIIPVIISNLNQKYGLEIKLVEVEDSILLPTTNKRKMTIRFNPRLFTLFHLYDTENADLLIKYFLTHKFMSYNMYEKVFHWAERTTVKIDKVHNKRGYIGKKQDELDCVNFFKNELIGFQISFVLVHEYSHVLFAKDVTVKNECFNAVKNVIEEISECDKGGVLKLIHDSLPWGARSFLIKALNMGGVNRNLSLINDVRNNEHKIEEFACDMHAWRILATVLHYGGYSLQEQIFAFSSFIESLYHLENYKSIDDCLSHKVDMSKSENIALFDSMRYSVLTHQIVMYLEGKQKGLGLDFDRRFSIFRWNERKDYVSSIYKFALQTKSLSTGANLPDVEKSTEAQERIRILEHHINSLI